MFDQFRARTALLVAAAVAAALITPGSTPAQARSVPDRAVTSQQSAVTERPVLSSDFGTARSRVEGTWRNGTVRGWFVPRRFETQSGKLFAIGRLHAILERQDGTVRAEENKRIRIKVKRIAGETLGGPGARQLATCDILRLVLGPLDLDLLGLQVHLNRVVLTIVAESGAGNLLGNLLCAIAGLLDNNGVLRQISQILNSILAILRL